MELTDLELAALMVRRNHAVKLMDAGALTGIEALALIVVPSPALLQASMLKAKESVRKRPHTQPTPGRSRTLDEVLAAA
jgi:hypothetical protein